MLLSGKYREGLSERIGRVPARLRHPPGIKSTIWLHAVSVGELLAAAPLISELGQHLGAKHPDVRVVISTTTRTGQKLAREKFGAENVFYFPFDFPWAVNRYVRALKPRLLVLLETEFWPNFLHAAQTNQIPLAVVNARVSDRSFPRYRRLRHFWARALSSVSLALAQSEVDSERLQRIGLPAGKVRIVGNLKYDAEADAVQTSQVAEALRRSLPTGSPVWVCGSTAAGEEAAILAAHADALATAPGLITVLAPRRPERFAEVAAILPANSVRRSEWMANPTPIRPGSIFLLDSVGELASVYALATIAYVGGSLFPPGGGHNPIEPARFSVPVMSGPFTQNFRGIATALLDRGAMLTSTPDSLAKDLIYLLAHPQRSAERGQRGRQVVEESRGATGRTLQYLLQLVDPETYEPPSYATEAERAWQASGRTSLASHPMPSETR
jgi:3-deoxy-D-manno-octulosonic-acid transferase